LPKIKPIEIKIALKVMKLKKQYYKSKLL